MNLQQLRHFVAISQFGHYGQAAKALYVTQSALSNSIKKLEGELGVRLFEHQGRNAVLTDRGKVFAARISPILNDLDNAISEIQADTEARQNKARLGAVAALMRGVLSSLLNSYNENAEEPILFDLSHMGSTKECEQNLLNNTLDIAFCGNPAKPNELNWIPLFPENAIVAVSSSHPLAKMQSVSLTDLRNYKQLSYREPSYMYYAFCGMFKKYNLSPQPAFEDEISALSATCVNPDAVTIMLDTVRDVAWDSIKLLSIKEFQRPYHWIGMAYRDKSSYETNIQAFISQMESLSESMSWVSPIENDFLEDW